MTSPLADTGITSPSAPSPQTLWSPSAWTPRPQRPQDGRTSDSTAVGPQKAAYPQPHNGGSCAVKPPTKAWSAGGAQTHDTRPPTLPPQPEGKHGSKAERRTKPAKGQTKPQNRTAVEERKSDTGRASGQNS